MRQKMQFLAWVPLTIAALVLAISPNFVGRADADEINSRFPQASRAKVEQVDFSNMQCMSCHQMKAGFSHPVNIRIKPGMNPTLPLVNGSITCATCHESGIDAHRTARAAGNSLLRTENTVVLCSQCHDSMDGTRASQHALAIGQAHLLTSKSGSRGNGMVRETQNCLSCHDGLVSSDVAMASPSTPKDVMADHPVNVVYRSRHEGAAEVLVKPASSLNPAIRLFEGRVGCGSCHSPYSQQEDLLVMSNVRSQLCFGCHNQ